MTLRFAIEREIRFAVVMYGGVSLAIYINGVAQELLRLSAATAQDPHQPAAPLYPTPDGTTTTYRTLAALLSMPSAELEALDHKLSASPGARWQDLGIPDTLSAKFVIDTISGTSAGGINGIFLGKALANNQSMDQIQQMWIQEGDLEKLINDKDSLSGAPGLPSCDPPISLLNGQRMYRRLVEALDAMDGPVSGSVTPGESGFVEELDVFATTTDINGLPVYLKLSDGVVTERRYKNVFQFKYRRNEKLSDFSRANNPFLAYAARCTSSFPVAFPPMVLDEVGEVLERMPGHLQERDLGTDVDRWRGFFPAYQPNSDAKQGQSNPAWFEFEKRPFCDGGYLDNKPFSRAIDALAKRVARLPVERKLIYIEPDPGHPELENASNIAPNPIQNAMLSQSLATYETIREDIERVLERNLLIERVNRLLEGSNDDVAAWLKSNSFDDAALFLGPFEALILKYGPSYGGYHRLKMGALTDEIGDWIGAAAHYQPDSAHINGIKLLVRAWREGQYTAPGHTDPNIKSETYFLYDFDLSYRIRRLRFVIQRLDALLMSGNAATVSALSALRLPLHDALTVLMSARNRLNLAQNDNPLHSSLTALSQQVDLLKNILAARTFDERVATARRTLNSPDLHKAFDAVAVTLRKIVADASVLASDTARGALIASIGNAQGVQKDLITQLQAYYINFQGYDFVSFPVIYATNVGEELSTTEVIRISPEDANSLVDRAQGDNRRKLAGTVLMHFGAFLEQKWRLNDMLWGRLDTAERLITSLLPMGCTHIRDALIKEAQLSILQEHFKPLNSAALLDFSSELINQHKTADADTKRLKEFFNQGRGSPGDATLAPVLGAALRQSMSPDNLLSYFKARNGYEISVEPTPDTSASIASRATTVFGKMLKKIGSDMQYEPVSTAGIWTTRAGQLAWGFIEVAMPARLGRVFWRHWLKLAYLVDVVVVISGIALQNSSAQTLGWELLALTLACNITVWTLGDWLGARTRARRVIQGVVVAALTALIAVGGYTAWTWVGDLWPSVVSCWRHVWASIL